MAIYGLEENDWSTKAPNRGRSYRLWAGILKHKETFFNFSTFLLGKGTKIRFWKDSLCEAKPLAEKFHDLFSLLLNKDAFIADCWCNVSRSWNLGLRRNVSDNEFDNVATILETLPSWGAPTNDHDSLEWNPSATGNFTTKSTFVKLTKKSLAIVVPLVCYIWKTKVPKKVKFFLWLLANRSLNTHEKLQKKKIQHTMFSFWMCCLCFKEEENLDHLFLPCIFTRKAWNTSFRIFNSETCLLNKVDS